MKHKIWKLRMPDQDTVKKVARENGLSEILSAILVNRGLYEKDKIDLYLNPSLEKLHDPYLLKDMDQAVQRILLAKERNEQIMVYGDYDVDGITSTSALVLFLKEHGIRVSYYIPDRIDEGYGLNGKALEEIKASGYQLVITVDTGITAIKEAEFAKSIGLDLIITDHHECQDLLPNAIAVINPKRADFAYPFRSLAGAGVTFKLIQGLAIKMNQLPSVWKYLELVAVGTVADIVDLQDENRSIVAHAFKTMEKSWNKGLNALFSVAGLKGKKLTAGMIGFQVGPRLNAAGRLGDAKRGVELFTAQDEVLCAEIAEELNNENSKRQKIEKEIFSEALSIIEGNPNYLGQRVWVVSSKGWNHGVIGIVASRLVEKYYRPIVLLTIEDGIASGSARSVEGFSIFAALNYCKELLDKFGGHEMAAGMTLNEENIGALSKKLNQFALENMDKNTLIPKLSADLQMELDEVDLSLAKSLQQFDPYGMGNEEPKFILSGIVSEVKRIGKEGNHLKLILEKEGVSLPVVAFHFGDIHETIPPYSPVEVIGTLSINEWQQEKTVQLMMNDIRFQAGFKSEISSAVCRIKAPEKLELSPSEIPKREDFAKVYRHISTLNADGKNHLLLETWFIMLCQNQRYSYIKALFCMEVFKELSLIRYRIEENTMFFTILSRKKVELKGSKLYNKWVE